jgi:cellulose synthase/poly-beta-1,6-N-acetylglucosamine synthase-like glycosyltransferase
MALTEVGTPLGEEWDHTIPSARVVVLVPAHNEEEAIEATIRSLLAQTRRAERIVVVCDNCVDRTAEIALSLGVEILVTQDNTQKKAGALNQALTSLWSALADDDYVLVMDADSVLPADFIESACQVLYDNPDAGAVSAAYYGKPDKKGPLALLQRMEYCQERRRVARRRARVTCLSGTATVFLTAALRHVLSERGKKIPGRLDKPEAYLHVSLTEDFEITLALRTLGYIPLSPGHLVTYTDIMATPKMLWSQRLRWQRGTLETLRLYGFNRITAPLYVNQMATYLVALATPFMGLLWTLSLTVLHRAPSFALWTLVLLPLTALESVIATWRLRSWKARLAAAAILPLWLYDQYRVVIYWHAAIKLLKREEFKWD